MTINTATRDAATYTAVVTLNQTQVDWQNASIKRSKIGSADAGTPTADGTGTITLTAATIEYTNYISTFHGLLNAANV